jgi:hypothetical protein
MNRESPHASYDRIQTRRALSLAEVVVVLGLLSLLIGGAVWLFFFGGSTAQRLTPQLSLQQKSRIAVVRLLREIQEGMEVLSPTPGLTLSYALISDKLALVRWYFLLKSQNDPGQFELWRYVDDRTLPPGQRRVLLLTNIRRLTFTCQSEGALQINLALAEENSQYSILTTVRLRNLPSAEELW